MNFIDTKLVILFALFVNGCSSYAYYKPENNMGVRTYGSACSEPVVVYTENMLGVADLHISAKPDLDPKKTNIDIMISIKKGSTVRLLSSNVRFEHVGADRKIMGKIAEFRSGIEPIGMEVKRFGAKAILNGDGSYESLPEPYGPNDSFYAELISEFPIVNCFSLSLPEMLVDGQKVIIAPIEFVYKKGFQVLCLQ